MEQSAEGSVLGTIRSRRSIAKMKPDRVSPELIEQWLDAAVWAPNHRLTEPWQFFVLEGDAKRRFAELRRDFRRTGLPNPGATEARAVLDKTYQSTIDTPAVIVVTARVSRDAELGEEDVWATYGAAYAFMLGAWSHGVGTYLRTGGLRDYPPLRAFLGLSEDQRVIGVLYVGYPAEVPQRWRTPASAKTVWLRTAESPKEGAR